MNFKVLFPDGSLINQDTVIKGTHNSYIIATNRGLCKVIKSAWSKWSGSRNFTEWAKELNADKNFEGTFTIEHALDNLCSNFHLEINGKAVDLYAFFQTHMPLKKVGLNPMETIKEHDIVITNQPFGYIPKNATGTVVHIYNDDAVEVEFDFLGSTAVETISTKFLTKK